VVQTENKKWMHPAFRWRKERIEELLNMIKKEGNAKIDELVAKLSLNYGLSERKVKEYLKTLEAEGKIKVDWFNGTATAT
jgi:DeoR/GlpR family transcriptional regulator of sugar metabolism